MKRTTSASSKCAKAGARTEYVPTTLSPFRYPGGKSRLRPLVLDWLASIPFRPRVFVEPFAGGASVGLAVAELGLADEVHLIERDKDVAAVWKAALGSHCPRLCRRILAFRMSRKAVVAAFGDKRKDVVSVAFRCLLRNRVQRGGILAPRAGLLRKGERGKGVHSRWYPQTLVKRLQKIHSLADRIRFTEADALPLLQALLRRGDSAAFIDPPYVVNGHGPGIRLYRHTQVDHEWLFTMLSKARSACLATYHASPEIRRLARLSGFSVSSRAMRTTHHSQRRELILRKPPADVGSNAT